MKHLLTLKDLSQEDLIKILKLALDIKINPEKYSNSLKNKSIAMLFEKPSLRTRVSFDVGINKLGGHCIYLDQQNGALGKREPVSDFATNLSCWVDAIVARTFSHKTIEELAEYGSVPVINALSDLYHPCQALADFLSLMELENENFSKLKLSYIGDGNNVTHSLMYGAMILGIKMNVITPNGYEPNEDIINTAKELGKRYGGDLVISNDISDAIESDAIYTDTWISMGDEKNIDLIKDKFRSYKITEELMDKTKAKYFMHCLPAYREVEVEASVVDGNKSIILRQAENRMHAQNAVLFLLLADK